MEAICDMELLKTIVLGAVQGATEFLPISSSGHLSIFQHFMGKSGEGSLLLSVLLHIGTLAAVLMVYYKTFLELIVEIGKIAKDLFAGKFSFKNMSETRSMLFMLILSSVPLLILLVPVGNGLNLMDVLGGLSEDSDIITEGVSFLLTAFLLLFGTKVYNKKNIIKSQVAPKDAVAVGFAQLFAAGFPGISRSGSTIATGMLRGVSKENMVRYSFILGIPAILAANAVEIKGAVQAGDSLNIANAAVGVLTAAGVGFAAIKLLQWIVKTDKFKFFGYYCLVLGAAVIIAGVAEKFI
jgi:undecaprenyl-diphosphatase